MNATFGDAKNRLDRDFKVLDVPGTGLPVMVGQYSIAQMRFPGLWWYAANSHYGVAGSH